MSFIEALIQGILQGLTEFLPVSSSGHVSLAQHFLGVELEGAQTFTLFLHFGTLIAVFIAYRKLIWELICEFFAMVGDLFRGKLSFRLKNMNEKRRMVVMLFVASACAILLFLPLFNIFGMYSGGELVSDVEDLSEMVSEDPDIIVEGVCLLGTAVLLLYATYISKRRDYFGKPGQKKLRYKHAIAMGIGQSFAARPGLSRSGTTTTIGMITGMDKNKALEFSFIMSIPAVLAANVLEVVTLEPAEWATFELMPVLVGVAAAIVFGILAIVALKWIVTNDKLHYFGYYCLIAGIIVIIIGIVEHINGVSVAGVPM